MEGSFCSVCGEALVSPLFEGRTDAVCGLCERAHPPFERAVAYGNYEGGLRERVHLLKFQQVRSAAGVLGRMLAEALRKLDPSLPTGGITVVPVPLHSRKRAQRGFNQAELIAKAAMKGIARPERFRLCTGVLIRQQRRENLRGAFAVTDPTHIAGENIVLVDDVYTTGTTVSECTRVLRRAGAAGVWAVTVARTLKVNEALVIPEDIQEGASDDRHSMAAHG